MTAAVINLMQAYELIALQDKKSNEAIIADAKANATASWQELVEKWDMTELPKLIARDEATFADIVHGNYQVSYITLPGLANLLKWRFGLQADKDFSVNETDLAIEDIKVDEATEKAIITMLSSNWHTTKNAQGLTISAK